MSQEDKMFAVSCEVFVVTSAEDSEQAQEKISKQITDKMKGYHVKDTYAERYYDE